MKKRISILISCLFTAAAFAQSPAPQKVEAEETEMTIEMKTEKVEMKADKAEVPAEEISTKEVGKN